MPVTATCVHHWLITEAPGVGASGVCKRCGEKRAFQNDSGAELSPLERSKRVYDAKAAGMKADRAAKQRRAS